jgi:uncharacterized protein YggE
LDFPRHRWASIQPANLEESDIAPADSLAVDYRFGHPLAMKRLPFVLLVLPGILLAQGGLPSQPYIYVEGKAEIEKPADMVTLRFDLVTRNVDQAKANQEVQAKATKVLALIDSKKIVANDVIAQDLRSEPEYEEDEDSTRNRGKFIDYKVTRSFSIKVRDFTIFPKLVDELIAVGGVEFSGIDAGLSKEKEMQDEVWEKALTNARERAEKTLKAIGMKIDSVFALSPVAFPEIYQKIFGSTEAMGVRNAVAGEPAKPDPTHYRLAPVAVNQSVHVIHLISPTK